MNYEQIPAELRALPQWVCFMVVDNLERGKPEKIPINPHTLRGASSTNPKAWGTLEKAAAQIGKTGSCKRKGGAIVSAPVCGVGFVFNGNGITGIDFDHVIDEQGRLEPWVADWVQRFGSYTEYSPSGTGLHILCRGTLGNRKCIKREEVEIYDRARYFTVTGKPYKDVNPLCDAQAALDDLYAAFEKKPTEERPAPTTGALSWDAEIGGSSQASSGAGKDYLAIGLEKDSKFRELWDGHRPHGNESADDQALMNKLAYWCNCNAAAMMNAFKQSPHCRQKDPYHMEKAVVREDYLQRTVEQAAKGCTRTAEYDDLNYHDQRRTTAAQDFAEVGQAEGAPEKIDYSRLIAKSAAEIDFSKTPPTIFYIEGIIAQGLTFLNAFSKVGKSRVILQMLLAICRGLSFFGKATKKSSVLYLALEDERRDFEGRLKAFLQGEPPPENLYWLTKEDFNYEPPAIDNGLFELLETQLKEHPEIKVIAIDVFGVIRSKRLQNEDFSMHERRDLNALLKFTAFNDLAMINAHHVSKTGMAQNRISSTGSGAGSYVLSGTVHTEIEIALDPDDPKRAKFSVKGRRMPAISFAIRDEYPFWKLEGDWAAIKIAENPIITTVKWLVSQNGTWKGSAKDLLDANKANSFLPPILKAFNKNTLEKLAREFQSAGIYYVQHPNGSGGVLHEFTSTDLSNDVIEIVDGETWEDIKLKV